MNSREQCFKGLVRAAALLALIIFVALPDSRSAVSRAEGSDMIELTMDAVDDGHDHSEFELIYGHCDDGLDCSVVAAIFSQPTLAGAVTLEQQLAPQTVHKLTSLSWPYDAPPPRILYLGPIWRDSVNTSQA